MATASAAAALRSVARPKQERSRQTLQRILDAAEALIEERGLAAVSIPAIVGRAGSSVGGFYARFRDKDELLCALEERFFQEVHLRLEEVSHPGRYHGASVPDIVRACVGELVATFRARRALIRCFIVRAATHGHLLDDGARFRERVGERMAALLLTRRAEIGHPEPEVAVDLAVQLAFGLVEKAAILGDLRVASRDLTDAEFVAELSRAFLAYLEVRTQPDSARRNRRTS